MIIRVMAIVFAACGLAALWFGYDQLGQLRRTPLWDFRYIVFSAAAFLGLSGFEWALGWIKNKISNEPDAH